MNAATQKRLTYVEHSFEFKKTSDTTMRGSCTCKSTLTAVFSQFDRTYHLELAGDGAEEQCTVLLAQFLKLLGDAHK